MSCFFPVLFHQLFDRPPSPFRGFGPTIAPSLV